MGVGLYLHRRKGQVPFDARRASRAVSEDPSKRGFLLIVRTGRIVTARAVLPRNGLMARTSTAGYSDVPAYSEVYLRPS